jgi:nitrite reductase/ring-hydroxylating ferredoxin subunit
MAFTKVATVLDVPAGQARLVTVKGQALALFNVNGMYYAIEDTCPHSGGPLSEGYIEGQQVECPWHGARFDVTTGAHLSPPARTGVKAFKVQVIGDDIEIDI